MTLLCARILPEPWESSQRMLTVDEERHKINPQEKYAMDVLKEQIREVESRLGPGKDERDQSSDSKTLDIPDRLDADKGNQIIGSFSGFTKQFSHKMTRTIARHCIDRIGHDVQCICHVHPDTGVSWGIERGELPPLGNEFAGLPDDAKPIYKKEAMWLWDSSKGPYLVLPNRGMTPVTLSAHYLTWRLHLPCLACSPHCLI